MQGETAHNAPVVKLDIIVVFETEVLSSNLSGGTILYPDRASVVISAHA